MTKEELKNQIIKSKENCKKLAEEYRERYNQDNENKIALNMFYHNVISYNDYESVLALFENRNSMIMCFSAPPVLTEETVEINLKRIAELEKKISVLLSCKNCPENKGGLICAKEYENKCLAQKIEFIKELQQENAELKLKLDALEGQTPWKDIKDKSEVIGKLTKAKELLAKWVELFKPKGGNIPPTPIQVDTEQFLKEDSVSERMQKAVHNYIN